MTALVVFLIGLAVIGGLWLKGHPSVIDRGPKYEGQKRKFFDRHSPLHFLGALIVAAFVGIVDGYIAGFLVSAALWSLVEIAQKNPRDGQGGYAEPSDFLVDAVGAAVGALIGAWLK